MSYELEFLPKALKEWQKLDLGIKEQFKKKLAQRLANPKVPKDKLRDFENVYKIKLKSLGYRLAYEVIDERLVVLVLVVGKRENNAVYDEIAKRFK
ncbi:type II toxin-antitoxin system RelE family toxin [Helicobacter sp. 23-1045]